VLEREAVDRENWHAAMPKRRLTNFTRLPMKERRRRKRKEESDNRKAHGRHHRVPRQRCQLSTCERVAGRSAKRSFLRSGLWENSIWPLRDPLSLHMAEKSASRSLGATPRCASGSPIAPRRYGSIPIRSLT